MPDRVLVAVPHKPMAAVITGLLRGARIETIAEAHDAGYAAQLLADRTFDAVVLDNEIGPGGGVAFTRRLRTAGGPNMTVPIVMISGDASRGHIEAARDAGIHEFLRLPVSGEALSTRLAAALANPRAFIAAPDYKGPDRRRKHGTFTGTNRRDAAGKSA